MCFEKKQKMVLKQCFYFKVTKFCQQNLKFFKNLFFKQIKKKCQQ